MWMKSIYKRILSYILFCTAPLYADLPYMPVFFKLSTSKSTYRPDERIEFRLKIYNSDKTRSYPIVLPGTQNSGQKLIRLGFYSVNEKTQFYTCVAKENPELKMNCEGPGNVSVRQLAPGDSTEIVFFLNDHKNFHSQTASHHQLDKPLLPGKYQVHIYYDPSVTPLKDLYHYIGSTNDSTSAEKLNFWIGGNPCHYIPIIISNGTNTQKSETLNSSCDDGCLFCKNIDEQNWSSVKKTIEKNIRKSESFDLAVNQFEWMRRHRNVLWVSAPPQEVLSSLPTYFSYEIVFVSRNELFYFSSVFQWGMVYQSRSRFNTMFRSSRPNTFLPGEGLSYVGLVSFKEATCIQEGQ